MSDQTSLKTYLQSHIPISEAMGVCVEHASKEKVILTAPFANNINHKKTVFGGSLHAVATLACWSLLHLNLEEVQIVITRSEVDYRAPVDGDFKAECVLQERCLAEVHQNLAVERESAPRSNCHHFPSGTLGS